MDYRVEELAQAADVSIDTIRFYQGKGILTPPKRCGRRVLYSDNHLEILGKVKDLSQQGFSLALIKRALTNEDSSPSSPPATPSPSSDARLLNALVEESLGKRSWRREEMTEAGGIPESFLRAAEGAGLIEAVSLDGEDRFGDTDLQMLSMGYALVSGGFPLDDFLGLAQEHTQHAKVMADNAIELFDRHVRKSNLDPNSEFSSNMFRSLLPQVTKLVALHFQHTLVTRALTRLRSAAQGDPSLEAAVEALEAARAEGSW
jgi:DNA-binding transcriptional MerR regulator